MRKWLADVLKKLLWDIADALFILVLSSVVVFILFLVLGGIALLLT